MNSPDLGMSENMPSPITEAESQQTDDAKHWNKSSLDKRATTAPQNSSSPKMESAATSTSPSHSQRHFLRQNGPLLGRKKFKLDEEECESLEMACNLAPEVHDDCDAFGRHVAAQLRLMNKMQKFMAQRLVSEICFRGQINHLTLSTSVVNNPPQQQQPSQQLQPSLQPTSQPHLQPTIFANRPSHMPASMFGRSADYLMLHQQGLRSSTAMPTFPNFITPQNDHSSTSLDQVG